MKYIKELILSFRRATSPPAMENPTWSFFTSPDCAPFGVAGSGGREEGFEISRAA
jgi:hypothetical protein